MTGHVALLDRWWNLFRRRGTRPEQSDFGGAYELPGGEVPCSGSAQRPRRHWRSSVQKPVGAYLPPGCACTLHTDHRPLRKSSWESPGLWDVRPGSVYRSCSAAGCAQARSCKQEAVGRCFYDWPSAGKWIGSRPIYGVGRVAAPWLLVRGPGSSAR